jgi:ribonuclease VapC
VTRKPKAIVLDSWAIMAYLEDEPAGEHVGEVIADANEENTPLLMCVVNVGEVWYIIARETSTTDAENSLLRLRELGIEFVEANWSLTHDAARYKSKHRMAYADCFAAALTRQKEAVLLTGDPEFKQIEREITIDWLKPQR